MDQRIPETAASVGIEFHLEKLTRTPNTVNAHRVIRLGAQKGVQDDVVESLFYGYFCGGADIGNAETLAELGHKGGLDYEEVLAMLASDEGRREGRAGDEKAHPCGTRGVASVALQSHRVVSGAVPGAELADTLRPALEMV